MRYTTGTLIRYPLILGGFLVGLTVAFINRDKLFMSDLDAERKRLDRTDEESKQLLLDSMDSINKARAAKR